jgi:hypothetical protein
VNALVDGDLARKIAGTESGPAAAEEAELCRRYARRLYHFGLRRLGAEVRAQDLAQEALVVTLEKLRSGEVREPERIGSFILGARTAAPRPDHPLSGGASGPAPRGDRADLLRGADDCGNRVVARSLAGQRACHPSPWDGAPPHLSRSGAGGGRGMTTNSDPCAVELGRLVDYLLDELPVADAERLEEHLFDCTSCAERIESIERIGVTVADAVLHAAVGVNVNGAFVERVARDGLTLREYRDLESGETAPPETRRITADRDLGEVLLVFPGEVVRTFPRSRWTLRVSGNSPAGRTELGRFVMDHSP